MTKRKTRRSTKVPTTPASTGSEDEADGAEQVAEATVHALAPSPDVQQGAHGVAALDDVVVPVVPPEGLQADQDAIVEELAGAGSETENNNANNTAPRGADTDEEEIYPVSPVGGSPLRERMETLPSPTPGESDRDVEVDGRDEPPRPQWRVRDRDEHRRVVEPQLARDGVRNRVPRGTDPYPIHEGFRTVPVSSHDRIGNQLAPAVPGRPKTIRVGHRRKDIRSLLLWNTRSTPSVLLQVASTPQDRGGAASTTPIHPSHNPPPGQHVLGDLGVPACHGGHPVE